jgi:hypothetical protein
MKVNNCHDANCVISQKKEDAVRKLSQDGPPRDSVGNGK